MEETTKQTEGPNNRVMLYPELPDTNLSTNPELNPFNRISNDAQGFRLNQISDVKKFFEEEIETRRKLFMKYKKAFDVITGISHFLNFASVAAGSVGVSALAGVITAPIGLALGGVTIGSAIISSALGWEKKNILRKIEKHEKISQLAISKLNTINDLVSKALTDSHISTEEFGLILKEKEKYISMKNAIRKKQRETNSNVDVESLKKTFLEEGKKLAQTEMLEKLKVQ
ncbi:hypothetical protein [Bartonella sp. CL27QHWL]|uniref:hypothetical protein n=1 Tax=Bartonella sp. CL27QHWL TaxID=3243521 RepID=UPI0035D10E72